MDSIDSYNLKIQEIEELKGAVKVKRLNEELLEHLTATVSWLIQTCERNNMSVPKKESIARSLDRAYSYLDKIPDQPTGNTNKNHQRGNSTCFTKLI